MPEIDYETMRAKIDKTSSWFMTSQHQTDPGPVVKALDEYSEAIFPCQMWREFRPTRDTFEFTLYFRIGQTREHSMKMRADFDVTVDEYMNLTLERMIELSKLAMLDVCLWVVEQGRVSLSWETREVNA